MAHISALRLTDFRSYAALDADLDGRPVILFGPNGAGKTNFLEALSLLSPGRGLRRAKTEIITRKISETRQAPAWGVRAELKGVDAEVISVGQVPEAPRRRIVRIDGKNANGTQLAKLLTFMWLTPAQDRLFTGPAGDRRKFLDRFSIVHAPGHAMASLRYEKARSERNRLLQDGVTDRTWFDALESDMAARGAQIARARATTLAALTTEIAARPEGAFPKALITLEGESETQFLAGETEDNVEIFIREALEADRPVDRRAGRTLRGVHRTDMVVRHAEKNMHASNCSTGEQKALLIGLFLAHARSQAERQPILLLDEIAAHLDTYRRAAMIEELLALRTQALLTGTDQSLFEAFADRAQSFEVKDSALIPHSQ